MTTPFFCAHNTWLRMPYFHHGSYRPTFCRDMGSRALGRRQHSSRFCQSLVLPSSNLGIICPAQGRRHDALGAPESLPASFSFEKVPVLCTVAYCQKKKSTGNHKKKLKGGLLSPSRNAAPTSPRYFTWWRQYLFLNTYKWVFAQTFMETLPNLNFSTLTF